MSNYSASCSHRELIGIGPNFQFLFSKKVFHQSFYLITKKKYTHKSQEINRTQDWLSLMCQNSFEVDDYAYPSMLRRSKTVQRMRTIELTKCLLEFRTGRTIILSRYFVRKVFAQLWGLVIYRLAFKEKKMQINTFLITIFTVFFMNSLSFTLLWRKILCGDFALCKIYMVGKKSWFSNSNPLLLYS